MSTRAFHLTVLLVEVVVWNSVLAISPAEFATEEKKYFPQVGDAPPVIKQKRDARELAIRAMNIQSGNNIPNIKSSNNDPLGLRKK